MVMRWLWRGLALLVVVACGLTAAAWYFTDDGFDLVSHASRECYEIIDGPPLGVFIFAVIVAVLTWLADLFAKGGPVKKAVTKQVLE